MYFEFDDQRKIHQPYTDAYTRMPVWKAPPYNTPYLNWKRGLYAFSTAVFIVEPINHFWNHAKLMNLIYEWPRTRSESNIFFKEVFRISQFWPELAKKLTFGLVAGACDTAIKLSYWQWIYGGTNSPQEFADSNSFKHLLCAILSFAPTCALTVPFENARRAYYADKSWPLELQRGYTSPTNALVRIGFEEGPGYLIKGAFPIYASQFMFWTTFCTLYTFIKNKFFFFWVYQDFSYNYIKTLNMLFSFSVASLAAYPFYFTREMVDLWPKERGGHCTWDNNYRKCAKWMIENMDQMYFNFLPGLTRWIKRQGAQYFIALWMADNLGMFSNCNEAHNSIEVQFPISSESV